MIRKFFLLTTFILISYCSFGQRNILHASPLKIIAIEPLFVPSSVNIPFTLTPGVRKQPPIPDVPSSVYEYYPAFFCRMELKSVKHFHVLIKVHAGDYDHYALPDNKNR